MVGVCLLPDGAERESKEKLGDSPAEELEEAHSVQELFNEHLLCFEPGALKQPHWRSLARLKGEPEPGTELVIRKGEQKE